MSKETKLFLELGCGPDWGWDPSISEQGQTFQDHEYAKYGADLAQTRAVVLGASSPETKFIAVEPSLVTKFAKRFLSERPDLKNVTFTAAAFSPDGSLPFQSCVFDTIEMNFLYSPITLQGIPYAAAIRECARLMKLGGILLIMEKKERIDRIRDLLSSDSANLYFFARLFDLEFENLEEASLADLTAYGRGALMIKTALEGQGAKDTQKYVPHVLKFVKKGN